MPVTADTYQPFDAGDGADVAEAGWRAMARHWAADGVLVTGQAVSDYTDFLAVTAGTGLQVLVSAGEAWVGGHYAEWETQSALTVGSNASGSTRVDVVVARADFVNNDIELDIVAGTPGAGAPALTQNSSTWEIPLAQYSVTNGASAPSSFVDRRSYSLPQPAVFEVYATQTQSTAGDGSAPNWIVPWETEVVDTAGIFSSGVATFTAGTAGLWLVSAHGNHYSGNLSSTTNARLRVVVDSSVIVEGDLKTAADSSVDLSVCGLVLVEAGDQLWISNHRSSSGGATTFGGRLHMIRVRGL
jgi:hypothetical protein